MHSASGKWSVSLLVSVNDAASHREAQYTSPSVPSSINAAKHNLFFSSLSAGGLPWRWRHIFSSSAAARGARGAAATRSTAAVDTAPAKVGHCLCRVETTATRQTEGTGSDCLHRGFQRYIVEFGACFTRYVCFHPVCMFSQHVWPDPCLQRLDEREVPW